MVQTGPNSVPRRLRVVYLDHVARLSGAEIALVRLLEATDEIDATVILAEDGELVDPLRRAGARVEVRPLVESARGLRRAEIRPGVEQARAAVAVGRYIDTIRRRLRALDPDLVHANSLKAGIYGTFAARLARLPVIWHLHDRLASDYLPSPVVPVMRALVATVPTALVTPSRLTLEIVGRHFRPGMRALTIPNAIPYPERPVEVRDQVRVVGIVGRLVAWKGQHVFLDAFAKAFPSENVRARVVGSALFGELDYERELRERALRLGIADRVEFAGFRHDVASEFAQLDLLVHASVTDDPLTTVVLEGMAAGLPVVATASGGHTEYVRDGREGVLHRAGDADDLAAALRRAAGDRRLRERVAAGGRKRATEFSPETVARRMLALYRELAPRPDN
jgi:glycosyltransferase involved in cell wall biosynthesis